MFDTIEARELANALECTALVEGGVDRIEAKQVIIAACDHIEKLQRGIERLKAYADKTYEHWDADRDSKVGKRLAAMAGLSPGYEPEIDAVIEVIIKSAKEPTQ